MVLNTDSLKFAEVNKIQIKYVCCCSGNINVIDGIQVTGKIDIQDGCVPAVVTSQHLMPGLYRLTGG